MHPSSRYVVAKAAMMLTLGGLITTSNLASSQDFDGISPVEADRWMYPFNQTPGFRTGGSVFGFCPYPPTNQVDNRDGQIILAFDTTDIVAPGQGADQYQVDSLVVEITLRGDASGPLDLTPDAWQTYLPSSEEAYQADTDAGRPIEMFAAGFRGDFTRLTWFEEAPFSVGSPFGVNNRIAFAAGFVDEQGTLEDVSSSFNDEVTPTPIAIGDFANVEPGETPLINDVAIFEFDLTVPGAEAWVQESLNEGRLAVAITSLIGAAQGDSTLTQFYLRENQLVIVGVVDPAVISLSGTIGSTCDAPGDLNNDCKIDGSDLGIFLGLWGQGAGSPGDLNGDGAVNGGDLGTILATYGSY